MAPRRSKVLLQWIVGAVVLAAAPLATVLAGDVRRIARVDLSSDDYTAAGQALLAEGYQPIRVSAYESNGAPRYAVVWENLPVNPWQERHGLTADEFQDQTDALLGQGFRLISLSVIAIGGGVRYSGIWDRSPGEVRYVNARSPAEFETSAAELSAAGFRPLAFSGFPVGEAPQLAAIWEKPTIGVGGPAAPIAPFQYRLDVAPRDVPQSIKTFAGQGYRPAQLVAMNYRGRVRYAGIWEQTAGPQIEFRQELSLADWQKLSAEMAGKRYQPLLLTAANIDGAPRVTVAWEAPRR